MQPDGPGEDSRQRRLLLTWPRVNELRRLGRFVRPHVGSLILAFALLAAATAMGLAVPWAVAQLTERVLSRGEPAAASAALNRLTIGVVGLLVLRALLSMGQVFLLARVGEDIVRSMREHLYTHLLKLGPAFYDERRVGELVSRLMNDVSQAQGVLTSGLAELLANTFTLTGALAILVWRSGWLTVATLVIVPPVVALARVYARQMRARATAVQDRMADATAVAEESLGAIRLVQIFVRESFEGRRFNHALDGVYEAAVARARVQAVFGPIVGVVTMGALVVVLWLGGREVIAGRIGPGDLVAFLLYAGMIASSASGLIGLYGRWAAALGATRRVFDWLDTQPVVADTASAREPGEGQGRIELRNVVFSYGRGDDVLKGVSLEVSPGETMALVGPTGAGKSTIMHLIARFYDPVEGAVLMDGVDVRSLTLHGLRSRIGVVPQETVLFNATIAENLRYGRLDASQAEIEASARAAYIHDFIAGLPDAYETLVGERGIRLSAGQRQRLAIARALLKDPRVLILDEATSSLDNESESYVQAALERLLAGRTTVVVAHRLSTVQRADRIAVVNGGRIVELGTHQALLDQGGLYARLHALQFRDP